MPIRRTALFTVKNVQIHGQVAGPDNPSPEGSQVPSAATGPLRTLACDLDLGALEAVPERDVDRPRNGVRPVQGHGSVGKNLDTLDGRCRQTPG